MLSGALVLNVLNEWQTDKALADIRQTYMKHNETQKYGAHLKGLSTPRLEKILSILLQEMRRRDSEKFQGDFLDKTKALWQLKSSGRTSER